MNWEYFFVIATIFVSIAVIVAAFVYSFQKANGKIYGSLWGPKFTPATVGGVTAANLDVAHEGLRWVQTSNGEVTIWAVVFLVVAVFFVIGHWRMHRA